MDLDSLVAEAGPDPAGNSGQREREVDLPVGFAFASPARFLLIFTDPEKNPVLPPDQPYWLLRELKKFFVSIGQTKGKATDGFRFLQSHGEQELPFTKLGKPSCFFQLKFCIRENAFVQFQKESVSALRRKQFLRTLICLNEIPLPCVGTFWKRLCHKTHGAEKGEE